jgi:hypothetical protein
VDQVEERVGRGARRGESGGVTRRQRLARRDVRHHAFGLRAAAAGRPGPGHEVRPGALTEREARRARDVAEQVDRGVLSELARDLDELAVLVGAERDLPERGIGLDQRTGLGDDRRVRAVRGRLRDLDRLAARGRQDLGSGLPDRRALHEVLVETSCERRRDDSHRRGQPFDQVHVFEVGDRLPRLPDRVHHPLDVRRDRDVDPLRGVLVLEPGEPGAQELAELLLGVILLEGDLTLGAEHPLELRPLLLERGVELLLVDQRVDTTPERVELVVDLRLPPVVLGGPAAASSFDLLDERLVRLRGP